MQLFVLGGKDPNAVYNYTQLPFLIVYGVFGSSFHLDETPIQCERRIDYQSALEIEILPFQTCY